MRIVQNILFSAFCLWFLISCGESDSLIYDDKFEGFWLEDSFYKVDLLYDLHYYADTTVMYTVDFRGDSIDTIETDTSLMFKRTILKFDENRHLIRYKFLLNYNWVSIDTFKYYDDDGILSYGYKAKFYEFESDDEFRLKTYPNSEFNRDKYGYFNPRIEFYIRRTGKYLQALIDSINVIQ